MIIIILSLVTCIAVLTPGRSIYLEVILMVGDTAILNCSTSEGVSQVTQSHSTKQKFVLLRSFLHGLNSLCFTPNVNVQRFIHTHPFCKKIHPCKISILCFVLLYFIIHHYIIMYSHFAAMHIFFVYLFRDAHLSVPSGVNTTSLSWSRSDRQPFSERTVLTSSGTLIIPNVQVLGRPIS